MSDFLRHQQAMVREFILYLSPKMDEAGNRRWVDRVLQQHTFLSTNENSVLQEVDGLVEKLFIHSQDAKARAVRQLANQVIAHPYGVEILAFLLRLQNRPLSDHYVDPTLTEQCNTNAVEDDINWTQLLMGPDIAELTNEWCWNGLSDDDDDEDDDDDGSNASPHRSMQSSKPPPRTRKGSPLPLHLNRAMHAVMLPTARMLPVECHLDVDFEAMLQANVQPEYWDCNNVHVCVSHDPSSVTRRQYCSMLASANCLSSSACRRELSEYQMIREVLRLLCGSANDFLFVCERDSHIVTGNRFLVHGTCCLTHVTDQCLDRQLHWFANMASDLLQLRCLYETMSQPGAAANPQQLMSTFAHAVAVVLGQCEDDLLRLEGVVRGAHCYTLTTLRRDLQAWGDVVSVLQSVLCSATSSHWRHLLTPACSLKLMDELHSRLLLHLCLNAGSLIARQLEQVFSQCLLTYLDILDALLSDRDTSDSADIAFLSLRQPPVHYGRCDFWREHFVSRSVIDPLGGGQQCLPPTPRLFLPLLPDLTLAMKSIHLLKCMSLCHKMPELLKHLRHRTASGRFVQEFRNKATFLRSANVYETVAKSLHFQEATPDNGVLHVDADFAYLHQQFVHRMRQQTLRIVQLRSVTAAAVQEKNEEQLEPDDIDTGAKILHVSQALEQCTARLVLQRLQVINRLLLETLWGEFQLGEHLHSLQAVYLCAVGYCIDDFLHQVRHYSHTQQQSIAMNFTATLQLCLAPAIPQVYCSQFHFHSTNLEESLLLSTTTNTTTTTTTTQGLFFDHLRLHFRMHSPLHFIVTPEHQQLYQDVFQFLCELKHSKLGLEEVHFSPTSRRSGVGCLPRASFHRCCLLRLRLMHLLGALLQYFSYHVIHQRWTRFQEDFQLCRDMQELVTCHQAFVYWLHRASLQSAEFGALRDALRDVMQVAQTLAAEWSRCSGDDNNDDDDFVVRGDEQRLLWEMENKFRETMLFLSKIFHDFVYDLANEILQPLLLIFDDSYLK